MQGPLHSPFPCPIFVKGDSVLLQGQTLVGMFAYRLVSGHGQVQTGVATGEGALTTAMVILMALVVGWQQRRPEWADVARLAMHVHAGRAPRGVRPAGADVVDVEKEDARDDAPRATHTSKRRPRSRPPMTRMPPLPRSPAQPTPHKLPRCHHGQTQFGHGGCVPLAAAAVVATPLAGLGVARRGSPKGLGPAPCPVPGGEAGSRDGEGQVAAREGQVAGREGNLQAKVITVLRKVASPESQVFTAYTGDNAAIHGAACYLPDRIEHLFVKTF